MNTAKIALAAMTVILLALSPLAAQTPVFDWYTANPKAIDFTISTADELAGLAQIVNGTAAGIARDSFRGKTVTLGRGIDLSGYAGGEGWEPIGSSSKTPFSGSFEGGGYVVRNLRINTPDGERKGLFGVISRGKVQNLGLERVKIKAKFAAGGLTGQLTDRSVVVNCYTEGGEVSGVTHVGGIAGNAFRSVIINCYSSAKVVRIHTRPHDMYVGGIAGCLNSSIITNSYSTGEIGGSSHEAGGIAGILFQFSSVTNSAALNPSRRRVAGRLKRKSTLENNVNFSSSKSSTSRYTSLHVWLPTTGYSISAEEIMADGTIGGRFTTGWTTEDGKLPGFGAAVDMPEHIRAVINKKSEVETIVVNDTYGIDEIAIINDTTITDDIATVNETTAIDDVAAVSDTAIIDDIVAVNDTAVINENTTVNDTAVIDDIAAVNDTDTSVSNITVDDNIADNNDKSVLMLHLSLEVKTDMNITGNTEDSSDNPPPLSHLNLELKADVEKLVGTAIKMLDATDSKRRWYEARRATIASAVSLSYLWLSYSAKEHEYRDNPQDNWVGSVNAYMAGAICLSVLANFVLPALPPQWISEDTSMKLWSVITMGGALTWTILMFNKKINTAFKENPGYYYTASVITAALPGFLVYAF